jgi:multidrug efflux pump subunit AcrA (membrane-fusion protein)
MIIMGAPKGARFAASFDEWFPQGLYLVGEIAPVNEYQSQEDKARNRPVRPRIDESSGKRLYRGTFADPSAEKEREKSMTVEFACDVQPVPPEPVVAGMPFRPVVLEGMTVQPRAEASGQAKWITWLVRADGMRSPNTAGTSGRAAGKSAGGGPESQKAA